MYIGSFVLSLMRKLTPSFEYTWPRRLLDDGYGYFGIQKSGSVSRVSFGT